MLSPYKLCLSGLIVCSACVSRVVLDVVAPHAAGELRNGFTSSSARVKTSDGKCEIKSF